MNIRTLVLGESYTGKTSFIRRKTTRYVPTIGVDYSVYTFNDVHLRIWDTAGHDRFKQVVQNFYADNMLIIFVYRDKETFAKIETYRREINEKVNNCKYVLIYNGKDEKDALAGEVYAIMYNMAFFPCEATDAAQCSWTWNRICEYCRLESKQGWVIKSETPVSNNSWRYCWWI